MMKALKIIGKVFLYIITGTLVLLILASLFIDPFVRNMLENQINDADQGQYTAQIEEVNINLIAGNFSVHGLKITTDTIAAREHETPVVDIEAGELSVEGVSWLDFLLTENLQLNRVSLLDINLEAKVRTIDDQEEEPAGPFRWEQLDIYPQVQQFADRVRLNDLRFSNLDLTLINIGTQDTLHFNAGEFNLLSDDILIDADRVLTDNRAFYASQIDIQGKDVLIERMGQDPWETKFGVIEFDTRESEFGVFSQDFEVFIGESRKDTVVYAYAREFSLNDLDLNRVQEDSVARIRKISLNTLNILNNIDVDEKDVEEADKQDPEFDITKFTLGDNLPDLLDRVIIREIDFQDISYKELDEVDLKNISINVVDMEIDGRPAFAEGRFMHAERFAINANGIEYTGGEPLHHINLQDFEINMENGTGHIVLNSLSAQTAESVEGELHTKADLPGLKILGIDTRQLPEKRLMIDSIAIEYPDLAVNMGDAVDDETPNQETPGLDLYPAISDMLNELHINKIALIQGNILVSGLEDNPNSMHLPAVYAQVSDLHIAEGTAFAGRRILHSDDIAIRLENINFLMPDNVHYINLGLLRMSTREKFIQGNGMAYGYRDNYEVILKGPESNQVSRVSADKFAINNLEFQDIIKQNGFFASAVTADGINVDIFIDNNFPAEEEEPEQVYPKPQEIIRAIELPVYLGELSVNNVNLTLEEIAEGGDEPGVFTLEELDLEVKNFSNVTNILRNNPEIILDVQGLIMGDGRLQTTVTLPMLGAENKVHVKGSIDTLDLTKLNQYTEYTSRFGMESGILYKVLWDFEAGTEMAIGEFGLSYEALNVQLSEEVSPEPAGTLYQIAAYLANAIVLDSDIAEEKVDPPRVASFEREKDEEESFVEHYIASLMAGFVEVMGFPLSIIDP